MRWKIIQFGLLITTMVLIAIAITFFIPGTGALPPAKPSPDPNGYTLLVKAGTMIPGSVGDFPRLKYEQLRALVEAQTNALELAREGMKFDCRVSREYSTTYRSNHVIELAGLRRLAPALAAEGKLGEMEQRTNDAAKCYLDMARLGVESARGGIIIDAMIGKSIDAMSRQLLGRLLGDVDARTCREIAETLEGLESHREAWKDIAERDRDWSRRVYSSFTDRLGRFVAPALSAKSLGEAERRSNSELLRTRQLMIDFAARA